jgi:hypothetical protein
VVEVERRYRSFFTAWLRPGSFFHSATQSVCAAFAIAYLDKPTVAASQPTHPTHGYAVDVCMLYSKTDNATSEHVHDQPSRAVADLQLMFEQQ